MRFKTLQRPFAVMLALSLVLELVPAPALAEALDEVAEATGPIEVVAQQEDEGASESQEQAVAPEEAAPVEPEQAPAEASEPAAVEEAPAATDPTDEEAPVEPAEEPVDVAAPEDPATDQDDLTLTPQASGLKTATAPLKPGSDITVTYQYDYAKWTGDGNGLELLHTLIPGTYEDGSLDIVLPSSLSVPSKDDPEKTVNLPVTVLDDGLFTWRDEEGTVTCTGKPIGSVTVPASVETVDFFTFAKDQWGSEHVPNLKNVTFAPGSPITMLDYRFENAPSLESITLPDHLQTIGQQLFQDCKKLKTVKIPETVTVIGISAFRFSGIETIELPDHLTEIRKNAFEGTPLTGIEIPNSVSLIGNAAFQNCAKLTSVKFGTSMTDSLLTSIGEAAFNCAPITGTLEIPNRVETIGPNAFAWKQGDENPGPITSVSLGTSQTESRLSYLGGNAFYYQSFTTITLPNKLQNLLPDGQGEPFNRCNLLETVIFPTTAEDTFTAVTNLKNLASLKDEVVTNLPSYITTIGERAFLGTRFDDITIPPTVETIEKNAFYDSYIKSNLTLSEGLVNIGEGAFNNGRNQNTDCFKSLVIPSTVKTISDNAFWGTRLSSLEIRDGETPLTIGKDAFCLTGGPTVVVPKRVTYLAREAFYGMFDVSKDNPNTIYLYNPDIDFSCYDGKDPADGNKPSDYTNDYYYVPFIGDTVIYYPQDAAEDSDIMRLKSYVEGEGAKNLGHLVFKPFDPNAALTHTITGTVPAGATVQLSVAGETSEPVLTTSGGTASFTVSDIKTGSLVYAVVSMDGYLDKTVFPKMDEGGSMEKASLDEDWTFTVTADQMTPAATAGNLRVFTDKGDVNVAIFDASGTIVNQGPVARAGYLDANDVPAGTYDVVAWQKNDYFSYITSVDGVEKLGLSSSDYAKGQATVVAGKTVELALTVPELDTSKISSVLTAGDIKISENLVAPGVLFYANVTYTMASGKTATGLKFNIPEGMELVSVSSAAKKYSVTEDGGMMVVTGLASADQKKGKVSVGLKVTDPGDYAIGAAVASGNVTAPLGSASVAAPGLELVVPEDTLSDPTFDAHVFATPGTKVSFAIGGTRLDVTATTNKLGRAKATLTIPENELGITPTYTVTALAGEGDNQLTAQADVSYSYFGDDLEPRVYDFWFVHSGVEVWLNKAGKDLSGGYYTVVAVPNAHPNLYSPTWPFTVSIDSVLELADTCTLELGMLDGHTEYFTDIIEGSSIRSMPMKLSEAKPMEGGFTRYTYKLDVPIGTGDIFRDLTSADIPRTFNVVPHLKGEEPPKRPATPPAKEVDELWTSSKQIQESIKSEVNKAHEQVIPGMSITPKQAEEQWFEWLGTDYAIEMTKLLGEKKAEELCTYVGKTQGIFDYGYHHKTWDPDGTLWATASDEEKAAIEQAEALIDQAYQKLAILMGDKKPLPSYSSYEEYLRAEYDYQDGLKNDPDQLKAQGYVILYNPNATGDEPDWIAVKASDGSTPVLTPQGQLVLVSMDGTPSTASATVKTSDKSLTTHDHSADAKSTMDNLAMTNSIDAAGSILDGLSESASVGKAAFAGGGKALGLLSMSVSSELLQSTVRDYGKISSVRDNRKEELQRLKEQLKFYEDHNRTNTPCYKLIKIEMGYLEQYIDRLNTLTNWSTFDTTMSTLTFSVGTAATAVALYAAAAGAMTAWTGVGAAAGGATAAAAGAVAGVAGAVGAASGATCAYFTKDPLSDAKFFQAKVQEVRAKREWQCYKQDKDDPTAFGTRHYKHFWYKNTILDPSGYTYEAVESVRVNGVVATIYQKVNDTWQKWDEAKEYEQVNPQTTDDQGLFAWDVPLGIWKVLFHKDGYDDVWSGEMEVPPAWTNVPINMLLAARPEVTESSAEADDDGYQYVDVTFDQYMQVEGDLKVTVNGEEVTAEWLDPVDGYAEGNNAAKLGKVLRIPVAAYAEPGTTLTVRVETAESYTGKTLAEPYELVIEVAAPSYYLAAGDGATYTKGSDKDLPFTFKRSIKDAETFEHFEGILVDGENVDAANYEAVSGSVVVTLKAAYLSGLSEGEHVLTTQFDDGNDVDATFYVAAEKTPEEPEKEDAKKESTDSKSKTSAKKATASKAKASKSGKVPATGDPFRTALPLVVVIGVAVLTCGLLLKRRFGKK